ncbi:MAG TPA: efflux transporter outer membrane subunit [Thermoanaerobaculia bacterium]|nr:efflux transporter outer membrane subunit [Thermoanaerobaculia bacterium]
MRPLLLSIAHHGRLPALALAVVTAAGCASFRPDYQRPATTLPEAYSSPASTAAASDTWWTTFGDSQLDRLVAEALEKNQDLLAAAARVEEARALAGVARADQFPQVWVDGSGSRYRFSGDNPQFPPGIDLENSTVRLTANASYELDFWGRYRNATAAARAELLATEAGRQNLRVGLTAGVVSAYFDLLGFDRQLAIARETLSSRQEAVRLQRLRFDAGTISELDLAQAEAELASTEATVPALERALRQTENRLGVLLGRVGGSVERSSGLDALVAPEVPVGLPSQLLARRPDVVAAEHSLVAANARIAVVRAAYFPSISLTAYAGSESQQLSNLLGSGTGIWNLALGLIQPIFQAGRTTRQLEAARAREQQLVAGYLKAVQTAFAEVEDALVARRTGATEREALARQVEALDRARRLAQLRYEAGDSSYLEVLDAERSLFGAELSLTEARRAELAAAVALFKALGGGFKVAAPTTP